MIEPQQDSQAALKYEVEVLEQARVELHVPFSAGARVIILSFLTFKIRLQALLLPLKAAPISGITRLMTRTGTRPRY